MKAFFYLCFLVILIGCSAPIDSKVLIGKYSLNTSEEEDLIFVKANHTYIHRYISYSKRVFESVGKWKYNSGGNEILFEEFIFFNDSGPGDLPPGNWFSKVSIKNKQVRLMYSSENDIYYFKNIK